MSAFHWFSAVLCVVHILGAKYVWIRTVCGFVVQTPDPRSAQQIRGLCRQSLDGT